MLLYFFGARLDKLFRSTRRIFKKNLSSNNPTHALKLFENWKVFERCTVCGRGLRSESLPAFPLIVQHGLSWRAALFPVHQLSPVLPPKPIPDLREQMRGYDQVDAVVRREKELAEDAILKELLYIEERINTSSSLLTDEKKTAFYFVITKHSLAPTGN